MVPCDFQILMAKFLSEAIAIIFLQAIRKKFTTTYIAVD